MHPPSTAILSEFWRWLPVLLGISRSPGCPTRAGTAQCIDTSHSPEAEEAVATDMHSLDNGVFLRG